MIRTSTRIAVIAIAVSLFLHILSIGYTVSAPNERSTGDAETETVALATEFESFADETEPVEPQPAADTPPEPEPVEVPTSQALVASPNPEVTSSPGTGETPPAQPETVDPTESSLAAETQPTEPETQQPAPDTTSPVDPDQSEDAVSEEAEAPAPSQALPVEATEAPEPDQRIAALPVEPAPTAPITPAPDPTAVPILPSEEEALDLTAPEETLAPEPEEIEPTESEQNLGGSSLAVTSSPRPPPRGDRPAAQQAENQPPPILLTESPLVAYARDGRIADWSGREGTGGAGNSTVTNYAGRVLVHLNNAPRPEVRNVSGSARVVFVINPNGSLASVDVVQSTGNFELDRAAMAQVRNASPFPRPPDGRTTRMSFIYRNR